MVRSHLPRAQLHITHTHTSREAQHDFQNGQEEDMTPLTTPEAEHE